MAFIPAVLQSVGVPLMAQVAVSTCTSATIASAASQVVGAGYPAYATWRSREMVRLLTSDPASTSQALHATDSFWLEYWAAFAALAVVEGLLKPSFPGYSHLRLLLVLWLQSRRYKGAHKVYHKLLVPAFQHLRPTLDRLLGNFSKFLALHDVQVLGRYLHEGLSSVPLLEYFVREDE